jgi:hypothetical protein
MDYDIDISPLAKIQIADAFYYYLEINPELAQQFMKELYAGYGYLKINPHYQKRYKNVRGLPLKKFPYLLLFTIDENKKTVQVISCFHTSQNPNKYPR